MTQLTQDYPVASVALTASDQNVRTTACVFRGLTLCETGASTAHVRVYDNASANSGTLLASIKLASGGSTDLDCYRKAVNGIRVDIVSGTVEGAVFWSAG